MLLDMREVPTNYRFVQLNGCAMSRGAAVPEGAGVCSAKTVPARHILVTKPYTSLSVGRLKKVSLRTGLAPVRLNTKAVAVLTGYELREKAHLQPECLQRS
jgi:hypothetical protein